MIIAIDSKEKKPYKFNNSQITHIKTGDYSIIGLEDKITIERKTKIDAYGTIGGNRSRFIKELERMSKFQYAAIVIECSLTDFLIQPVRSKLLPKSAINSLIAWSIRYGVHVWFACGRVHGRILTLRILEKFWKEWGSK
jgi:ERCC4-type nuclease